MLVLLFRSVEDAINELATIREELIKINNDYGKILEQMKIGADVEGRLAKAGYRPSHRVITIQAVPNAINIHIMPHYTWLQAKLKAVSSSISFVVGEIEKVRNYLSNARIKNAMIMVVIDEERRRTRLVIMP